MLPTTFRSLVFYFWCVYLFFWLESYFTFYLTEFVETTIYLFFLSFCLIAFTCTMLFSFSVQIFIFPALILSLYLPGFPFAFCTPAFCGWSFLTFMFHYLIEFALIFCFRMCLHHLFPLCLLISLLENCYFFPFLCSHVLLLSLFNYHFVAICFSSYSYRFALDYFFFILWLRFSFLYLIWVSYLFF